MSEMDQWAADALTGRPNGFSVNGRHFLLHPLTLGKVHVLKPMVEKIGVDVIGMAENMPLEALRLAKEKRKECIDVICCHTCSTKEEVFDAERSAEVTSFLDKELTDDDVASLMVMLLASDKVDMLMHHFGIDKEQVALSRTLAVKNGKNSMNFGGLSVFGTLLDAACERYGWTKEYVVWGIDYASLRLMLADKVTSVYLSDEELAKVPLAVTSRNEDVIQGTKENMAAIKSMGWK